MQVLIIGVAGPSAGGKTTVTQKIRENFSNQEITVISYDDYYKDQTHLTMEQRYLTNYDHPNSFDTDLLIDDLKMIISGNTIKKPIYDFINHNRSEKLEIIAPTKIIIVEGLFTLLDLKLRNILNIKVFVDADPDECFIRRLLRDTSQRARSMQSVIDQYLKTVKPMQEQFIQPTRKYADLVILRGGENEVAINLLSQLIQNHLSKGEL